MSFIVKLSHEEGLAKLMPTISLKLSHGVLMQRTEPASGVEITERFFLIFIPQEDPCLDVQSLTATNCLTQVFTFFLTSTALTVFILRLKQ